VVLYQSNHHKRCSDLCASKTTDRIHAFIQIICNVSILGSQVQGPQQKLEKRGKSFKQVVGRKTCNNKSCRATWAVFYILMGFVARYSLRYFNQYETKCISANLLAFLSRISKHYLHGSIIKMCISWFLSWWVISIVWFSQTSKTLLNIRESPNASKPCNNLQTFKTIYKISESFLAW
jgi:hypothetical protein